MDYFHPELVQHLVNGGHPILAKAYEACKDKKMGFKRCGYHIVAMQLPPKEDTTLNREIGSEDRRQAKFRAKYIPNVEFIYHLWARRMMEYVWHRWETTAIDYIQGKDVHPDLYDDDLTTVCSHGIHFYLTLEAALGHCTGWNWAFEKEIATFDAFLRHAM